MKRKLPIALVGTGAVLIAGAGILRFGIAPYALDQAQLKGNTDVTRTYTGTAATLFNQAALLTGQTDKVFLHDVAGMTFTHSAKVLSTHGDTAVVQDTRKAVAPNGVVVAEIPIVFSVDRHTMGGAAVPAGVTGAVQPAGVTFNFPINTQAKDYTGYVSENASTTTLKYVRTESRGGRDAYVFTSSVSIPITQSVAVGNLPTAVPKSLAAGLVPAALKPTFQQLFPSLPALIPLTYTYIDQSTYWVDPVTGIVFDLQRHEVRNVSATIGTQSLPVGTVLDATYTESPSELSAAVAYVEDQRGAYDLINGILPLIALIGGGVFVAVGGVLFLRRKPESGAPTTGQPVLLPAGIPSITLPAPRTAGSPVEADLHLPVS